jgi:hypothetical protein
MSRDRQPLLSERSESGTRILGQDPWSRVEERRDSLAGFLSWAAVCEGETGSRRFENRTDLARVSHVVDQFDEQWWAVVVYSCFDSEEGTRAVLPQFRRPRSVQDAERIIERIEFPKGSVKHHRRRAGLTGAKTALLSACASQHRLHDLLHGESTFEARYEALRGLRAPQWGRTTCFDLLARACLLRIGGRTYRPTTAQLAGSTGPRRGFEAVWGIRVTKVNAVDCEELLRWWTVNWNKVCELAGVSWRWRPFDPADLENYLCIFNESST